MAEASPICRGKNLTLETVLTFINAMPLRIMRKDEFNQYAENRIKGWTTTHSQIARQMALYYEGNGFCIPRFSHKCNYDELIEYVHKWATLYFVPNPYTPSLSEYKPTNIYASIKSKILAGETDFKKACSELFNIELNSTDKVRVYLTSFTDIIINEGLMSLNQNLPEEELPDKHPDIIDSNNAKLYFEYFGRIEQENAHAIKIIKPLASNQLIYYGAPGTGKSYKINQKTKDNPNVIRTTFHPDSDYSTFVGAYKPTMRNYKVAGSSYKLDGDSLNDNNEEIVYEFVPQAFLQAYVNAWKLLAEATDENNIQPEFLIIEEINRGNCAQIFGDLFQLLDRRDDGFSDYPIHADRDLQGYLRKIFQDEWLKKSGEKEDTLKASLNRIYGKEKDVKRVLDGEILLLPCNLYIWATMNTSDQSLFPIDSAFKRRWDWKYVPISRGKDKDGTPLQWKIKAGDKEYDWWSFLKKINERIYKATESEDKQLGYFFCKAGQNGCITTERFVNKVLFYLWNDVFKDYDTKDVFPEDYPTFDRFFTEDGNADDTAVESFLHGLELESVTTEPQTARISETSGEKVE